MKKNKNYQKFYHLGTISATNDLMYHSGKVLGQDEPPVLFFSHSLETEIIIQGKQQKNWIMLIITRRLNWINHQIDPLSTSLTKWSKTFKQFAYCCQQIVLVCLNILWGWDLKGWWIWQLQLNIRQFYKKFN